MFTFFGVKEMVNIMAWNTERSTTSSMQNWEGRLYKKQLSASWLVRSVAFFISKAGERNWKKKKNVNEGRMYCIVEVKGKGASNENTKEKVIRM